MQYEPDVYRNLCVASFDKRYQHYDYDLHENDYRLHYVESSDAFCHRAEFCDKDEKEQKEDDSEDCETNAGFENFGSVCVHVKLLDPRILHQCVWVFQGEH